MDRVKLAEKLDKELDDYIDSLPKKTYEDGWSEDRWKEQMEEHPFFRTQAIPEGGEVPPLVEAMQQLKYDPCENTPEELALSFKTDGNMNFKYKKYRWAVELYTKGIEARCENNELNAQLYANRATAQYYIGNFKKALKDAVESKKLKPDHLKAFQRGAMCCFQLKEFADCISWCNEGLKVASEDKTLVDLKTEAEEQKKIEDRNKRKALVLEAKKKKELEALKKAIQERGICLADENLDNHESNPLHPALTNARVHLDADKLVWPVILMYPEYGTTDYIHKFHEDTSLGDHLEVMFDPKSLPDWDKNREYVAENLQIYFSGDECVVPVDKTKTLMEILSHKRYKVHDGTPCFLVTVCGSSFDQSFRKKNTVIEQ